MHVLVRQWELHLEGCHSLKEKRALLKPLTVVLRRTFNVSVAETGHQDLWQRARLTAALTGGSLRRLAAAADEVERWVLARSPDGASVERLVASIEDLRG